MIIVDVNVPSIGRKYDFSLEEQTPIGTLIPEIVEVICQKEVCRLGGDTDSLTLCSMDSRQILDPKKTLSQYGITDGGRLLLV